MGLLSSGFLLSSQEGGEPLEVLYDPDQVCLHLQTSPSSHAGAVHPVATLRLGKAVLAADPQAPADLIGPTLLKLSELKLSELKLSDPVPGSGLAHFLPALALEMQIEGAPLPGGDFLFLLPRLQGHVGQHVAIQHGGERSGPVARSQACDLHLVRQAQRGGGFDDLVEYLECDLALRAGVRQADSAAQDHERLFVSSTSRIR